MRARHLLRIRIILSCVILVALVLLARLYMLQVVHGESFRREASAQYVRTTHDLFDRGAIYFTEKGGKRIAAASTKVGSLVAVDPGKVEDIGALYDALAPHTTLERDAFYMRLEKKEDPYEEVAWHIEAEAAGAIKERQFKGVQLYREQWRYYPGSTLASHVLGFVGWSDDGDTQDGRYGLERYWESVLSRASERLYVNFFAEVFASVGAVLGDEHEARAGDIVTTIEPSVQRALEGTLKKAEGEWHAKHLGGIIMDPKTGEIYALAALPEFDPNMYASVEEQGVFRNPIVEDVYEMGSIIKPLAMAIGLDTGAVRPTTTYDDTGSIKIDTATISNYDGRARGVVDMQQVLNQSLNVGMAFVARQVGREQMGERMRALGFGEETGIDLPFEAHGLIDNLESPRNVEYATAAFGQGIALTPIATARALSALGNGGYLVTPHLVRSVVYENGTESNVAPDDRTQVFSEKTSEEISRMLVEVVDTALRNGTVKKEHYAIAAKTGTAQIAKKGERGYYDDRYLHSFFGYFPAYEPRFLVFLYHVEPEGAKYASETLTDPFIELVDFLINYYEIPPDR